MRTLRVRELCRHDRDTSPVNNQQRGLDIHVGYHMFDDDLLGWTTMSGIRSIPYEIPFVYRYDTCPKLDLRYPYTLFNLVTGKSLYSFRNTSSRDQLLDHILCTLWWCPTEWAQRYLSVIRSDKSQSRFVPTQQTLSEIPVVYLCSHPVTLWCLAHPKHS